jgi:hypothetical protein
MLGFNVNWIDMKLFPGQGNNYAIIINEKKN